MICYVGAKVLGHPFLIEFVLILVSPLFLLNSCLPLSMVQPLFNFRIWSFKSNPLYSCAFVRLHRRKASETICQILSKLNFYEIHFFFLSVRKKMMRRSESYSKIWSVWTGKNTRHYNQTKNHTTLKILVHWIRMCFQNRWRCKWSKIPNVSPHNLKVVLEWELW